MLTRNVQPPRLRPVWDLVLTILLAMTVPPIAACTAILAAATVEEILPEEITAAPLDLQSSETVEVPDRLTLCEGCHVMWWRDYEGPFHDTPVLMYPYRSVTIRDGGGFEGRKW